MFGAKSSQSPTFDSTNLRKNFIWNTIGSTASAFISLVLMMIVTRANNIDDVGVFSFACSAASLFYIVGIYCGRTFQVTDINKKTTDSDYFYVKFVTCIAMLIIAAFFCIFNHYDIKKVAIIMLFVLFRAAEAISESCYAIIQKKDRLYQVGRSAFIKTLLSVAAFLIVDFATSNLILSCGCLILVHCLVIIIYDLPRVARTGFKMQKPRLRKVWYILRIGFFTFGFSLLSQYLLNVARFSIDAVGSNEDQAIFGILVMPASIIVLCGQYLIQPLLTNMKKILLQSIPDFVRLNIKICLIVLAFGCVCIGAASILGIPILELLYAVKLDDHIEALLIIVVSGILSALVAILSTSLIVMRQTGGQLVCYLIASIISFIISKPIVRGLGVFGGCLVYLLSICTVFVLYLAVFIFEIKKFHKDPSGELRRATKE